MRSTLCGGALGGLVLACSVSSHVAQAIEPIPVRLDVRDEWVVLPPTPDDQRSNDPVLTHAAVRIPRFIRPETQEPYDASWPFDCKPEQVHHSFHLQRREFVLGEPILIEYRVSLEGSGEYAEGIGGNYRSRGRDDNFLFLMRHEDGTWVGQVEPYSGLPGGGLRGDHTVKEGEPISLWFAAQRWCTIEKPGRYDLYCICSDGPGWRRAKPTEEVYRDRLPEHVLRTHTVDEHGNLFKIGSSEESDEYVVERIWNGQENVASPILTVMPAALGALLNDFTVPMPNENVRKAAEREFRDHLQRANAFAHFSITLVAGTPEVQRVMLPWVYRGELSLAEARLDPKPEGEAILDGIYFSMQPHFLSAIRDWTAADPKSLWGFGRSIGLGINPYAAATSILLEFPRSGELGNVGELRPDWYPNTMSNLIELLGSENANVRNGALYMLRKFSGGYFFADDAGSALGPLSDSQMKEAQVLWRTWWSRHKTDFHSRSGGIWGFINTSGAFVIPPCYALATGFRDGVATVSFGQNSINDDAELFFIDKAGVRQDVPYSPYGMVPLRPVRVRDSWGYENAKGELIIPARYEWVLGFSDGLAPVRNDGKMGYIDEQGEIVIPLTFDRCFGFHDGYASAEVNARWGIIDRQGNFIVEPKYVSVGPIVEGRASFQVGDRCGFLDDSGQEIIQPRFSRVQDFKNGLARVEVIAEVADPNGNPRRERRVGFINRSGEYIVEPRYQVAEPFAGDLAAVRLGDFQNQLWGYIDRAGEMVIPARYSQARSFSEGLAAVCQPDSEGGKWGFIDPLGMLVIPPEFDSAHDFSEGLAAVRFESPYFHFTSKD